MVELISQPPLVRDDFFLEDFIMLGTTVPEADYKGPNKGKKVVVCSAGVSELGLTRIHPLDWRVTIKRWHRYRVHVRKAGYGDTRPESYEPANTYMRNADFAPLGGKIHPGKLKPLLDRYKVESLKEADRRRISLAIVEPEDLELRMIPTERTGDDAMDWFRDERGNIVKAKERFRWIPRLFFKDAAGYEHRLQLRDWGVYEFMRKRPEYHASLRQSEENTIKGLNLSPTSCLFMGNNMAHRTAWLVISVLNGIR